MDALGQFQQRAAGGIDYGSFGGFDESWITFERFAIAVFLDNRRLGPDVPRGQTGCTQFVKLRLIHSHGIGVDRRALETVGQREDHARIHTPGKIGAHRHVRAQPLFDGVQEKPLEFIDQRARVFSPFLFTLGREIHFPIGAFRDDRTLARISGRNAQAMSRGQKLNPFKTSSRPGDRRKCENVIESLAVGSRRNHSGSEQTFDFGGEEQPIALPAPEKWGNSKPIASEVQLPLPHIPERNGKLSPQLLPGRFAVILPEMRNDLGVAVSNEAMAFRGELFAPLDVIEELAVEDHKQAAIFVGHRLLAIGQSDNAQAARGQGDAGSLEKPLLIRTAMDDCSRHPLQHPARGWSFPH